MAAKRASASRRNRRFHKEDEMSSVQPPQGTGAVAAPALTRSQNPAADRSDAGSKIENEAPVSIDTIPSAPPPEVLEHVAEAGKAFAALQAQGLEVNYNYDPHSRRTTAELRHIGGGTIKTLTLSEAMVLASGGDPVRGMV